MKESKLKTNDADIYYWIRPGNPNRWVIFLHGAGLDHHMFDMQMDAIPVEYSVLRWDARCHGQSVSEQPFVFNDAIRDLLEILHNENITEAVFIGQSMGGNIAQAIAMAHPKLVKGLVIIDATRNAQTMTLLEKFYVAITPAMLAMYPRKMLIDQTARACGLKQPTQEYVRACFERMAPRSFISVMSSLLTCVQPNESYKEPCPMLLVCGDHDKSGNIMRAMQQWPEQNVHIIPDAGHNSNQDQPDLVNRLIVDFLNTKV